jgi:cell volume regulation protein A
MNAEVFLTLSIAGLIMMIGSISIHLFKKTGLPDMIFLIGLGVFLGPILKIIPKERVIGVAPILAVLALLIILFDGGLSLDISEIFSHAPRALLLASIGFFLNIVAVMVLMKVFVGLRFLHGALLGSIIGGSSSIVIVTLAKKVNSSDKTKVILMLESAMTDVLCMVIALALIHILTVGSDGYTELGKDVIANFTTGSVVGAIIGLFWINMLPKIKEEPYKYMLTLSLIFLGYVTSENIGGSGAMSALIFGVILGNEQGIRKLLKRFDNSVLIDNGMRRLQDEMVFLIKSFFFVYLGLIISITNLTYAIIGIIISLIFLGIRYMAVSIASFGSILNKEKSLMTFLFTRGLAAAVLSTLTLELEIPFAELYINVAFVVIIFTGILSALGIYKYTKVSQQKSINELSYSV